MITNREARSAIILAAGESSRFWPLSAHQHKTLFVLGGMSLLERTVHSLVGIGVEDIVIVQSPRPPVPEDFVLPSDALSAYTGPARLRFVEQPTPAGQGDAIERCADFVGDWFFVVQPENVNAGDIALEIAGAGAPDDVVVLPGCRRADYSLYAVLEHDGERLAGIVEKPPASQVAEPMCSMGLYLFQREFLHWLAKVEPGPLSIIHAIDRVAKTGRAAVVESRNEFLPLKFPGHLWAYARVLGIPLAAPTSTVSAGARGRYLVSAGCVLGDVMLDDVVLGPGATVGSGTTTVGSPAPGDELEVVVIGAEATIGANVEIQRGTRIGARATIGSGARVAGDIPDGATVPGAATPPSR